MIAHRPKLAALVAATVLAAPTAAWAQGAVDEEYRESVPGGQGGGSETEQPAPTDDTGTDTATPTAPSGSAPATTAPEETAAATSATGELPRTGLPAVLIALTGGALVAAGTALRRRSY